MYWFIMNCCSWKYGKGRSLADLAEVLIKRWTLNVFDAGQKSHAGGNHMWAVTRTIASTFIKHVIRARESILGITYFIRQGYPSNQNSGGIHIIGNTTTTCTQLLDNFSATPTNCIPLVWAIVDVSDYRVELSVNLLVPHWALRSQCPPSVLSPNMVQIQ
jgi:hypothetical protein